MTSGGARRAAPFVDRRHLPVSGPGAASVSGHAFLAAGFPVVKSNSFKSNMFNYA